MIDTNYKEKGRRDYLLVPPSPFSLSLTGSYPDSTESGINFLPYSVNWRPQREVTLSPGFFWFRNQSIAADK